MYGTSSITGNKAITFGTDKGAGGGILNGAEYIGGGIATLTMNDLSSISGNKANILGGGIYNHQTVLNMNSGSSITGNIAIYGAGIANTEISTVNMYGTSSITGNGDATTL